MAQTVQHRSFVFVNKTKKEPPSYLAINTNKPETEDNINLLFSVCDSLNILYTRLDKLDYMMKKKIQEINTSHNEKESKR